MTLLGPAVAALALTQLPPTLAHLLQAARERNQALGISRAELEEQEADVEQAFAAFLPSLRASGGYTRNQYQAVISLPANLLGAGPPTEVKTVTLQPYDAWSANVALNVPLFAAGNLYRYAQAKQSRALAQSNDRATEAQVLLSTAQAYYRLAGAQGVVVASERALGTAEDSLRVTRVRLAAGTQTRLAVDRAQVDVARAEQAVVSSRQVRGLASRALETLTGERLSGPLPPLEPPVLPARTEAAFVDVALAARPELARAAAALKVQELQLDEAWAQLAPSLSGSASESFTNVTGFTGQHTYWGAGLSVAWNVDPWAVRAAIRKARAAVDEQRHRLAQEQEAVRDEVHAAWLDVEAGAARSAQAATEKRSALDALAITQQQYAAGTATSLDLSQAQRDAFTAEATAAQSEADLAAALVALRKAAGEPFWQDATGGGP